MKNEGDLKIPASIMKIEKIINEIQHLTFRDSAIR